MRSLAITWFCGLTILSTKLLAQAPVESFTPTELTSQLYSAAGSKSELLPIEVLLNDSQLVTQNVLRTVKGPAIQSDDLVKARLVFQGDAFHYGGETWVLLTQIQYLGLHFDASAARLNLRIDHVHLATQKAENSSKGIPAPTAIPALISNYDWSSTRFSVNGQSTNASSIVLEHIASFGALRFNQSWAVNSAAPGASAKMMRVDTGMQYEDLASARTWWAGDNFTSSQTWGRAYRLLGVGVYSNFAGRPDKQVLPRPAVSGFLVEPAGYELFLDNKKVGSGQFEAGQFEINNIPAVLSNGDVRVVFKDALGREQVKSVSFFAAPRQLAHGVTDYQFNVGKLRTGFEGDASDYGDWVMSAEYGLGLTPNWTLRGASEFSQSKVNVGLRQIVSVGGHGAITLDTAVSNNEGATGWYLAAQTIWTLQNVRWTLAVDQRSKNFWQIGNTSFTTAQRESGISSALGFNLGSFGNLGFAAALEKRFDGTSAKNVSASYSKQLSKRANLTLSANSYRGAVNSKSIYVMLNYSLDAEVPTRINTSVQNTQDGSEYLLSLARDASAELPVALQVSLGSGIQRNRTSTIGLQWTPEVTSVQMNLQRSTGNTTGVQTNWFASGSGSVTATSHGIFPSARIYDSAILVDLAGAAQVRTHIGSKPIKTNDAGFALVSNAASYAQNQTMFEPSDLPLEVGFSSQIMQVTPWPRGVALAKFDVINTEGESFRVVDKNNQLLTMGAEVLLPDENQFIGKNGILYLPKRPIGNALQIKTSEATLCVAKLPERNSGQTRSEPLTVICE